jgi:hypothetical protein
LYLQQQQQALERRAKQLDAREALLSKEFEQQEKALQEKERQALQAAQASVGDAQADLENAQAQLKDGRDNMEQKYAQAGTKEKELLESISKRETVLKEQLYMLKRALEGSLPCQLDETDSAHDLRIKGGAVALASLIKKHEQREDAQSGALEELENRIIKLQQQIDTAAEANSGTTSLSNQNHDLRVQRDDLQNIVRSLQKEELELRVRILQIPAIAVHAKIMPDSSQVVTASLQHLHLADQHPEAQTSNPKRRRTR